MKNGNTQNTIQKKIKLAGLTIDIHTQFDFLSQIDPSYLTDGMPDFSVQTTMKDIDTERKFSIAEHERENIPYPDFSPKALENTAIYRKIGDQLPFYDAIVFHGAAVAVGDKAYLFTAPSGTGKTTHVKLWLKNIPGSYIVNGDKPILRFTDNHIIVCGTPWMGKENFGQNINVPLRGLCIIKRGKKNTIHPIDKCTAMPILFEQSYRPSEKNAMIETMKVLERILNIIPMYELTCNMEDEAAVTAYKGMNHEHI